MIKRLEIKQASALWHIDGTEISMFHQLNITADKTSASIKAYRDAMFLVFAVLVALQLLINRSVTKAMQWSGISFAVAGGLALTVSLLCITLKISERLNIEPDYFRDFFDTIISGMATSAAVAGLALLSAGVLFVVAHVTAKKKRRA